MLIARHLNFIISSLILNAGYSFSFHITNTHTQHYVTHNHLHHHVDNFIDRIDISPHKTQHLSNRYSHHFMTGSSNDINSGKEISFFSTAKSYIGMMRPITIIQAVGAFLVGRLVILTSSLSTSSMLQELPNIIIASLSIYLSYGAGMAMNDCADVGVDSMHEDKQHRSLASENVSLRNATLFCVALSIISVMLSLISNCNKGIGFPLWNLFNLTVMATYALGLQRIFLVKNLICGYLAIAPLIGASLLGVGTITFESNVAGKLYKLAAIGFPLQVAREILKDIEDIQVDKGIKKTLPLGELACTRLR